MSNRSELSRRSFIRVIGVGSSCFVLGSFSAISCASEPARPTKAFVPNAFVKLDPQGFVTVTVSRSDMGQGVRTVFAMLVAEEMDVDMKKVRVEQADADTAAYGGQGTGGSSSVRSMYTHLRQIGAAARDMLINAAAKQWNVKPEECMTETGAVVHTPTGRRVDYGMLTELAAMQPVQTGGVRLKRPADFKLIGKGAARVDNLAVVTGKAGYGIDSKTDGMVYAAIARPPAIGANLKSFDDTEAKKKPGVVDVKQFENGVAVFASNTWAALNARDALKIVWDPQNADVNSATLLEKQRAALVAHPAMPAGVKVIEATYDHPFLAHATMEPMNALAHVEGDRCTVWAPTQVPDSIQNGIAETLKIPKDNVTVHVTLLGGGFGRRLFGDFVMEAVQLSKMVGKPVKLTWSREDDMKNDFYRPACHHSCVAALDSSGKPVAWSHQAIEASGERGGSFGESGLPYDIPNAVLRHTGCGSPIRTGPWRSVENSILTPANECFIDELAHAAGKDPFEFRRDLIKSERLRKVLEVAAEKAGWGTPLPQGTGRGIACFEGYGSYVAHVVELSVHGNKIKLHRAVIAVDCGVPVNPKGVEALAQGGCTDGLSTALRAAITFDKGAAVQNSWTDYQWMTMDAMPKQEVVIVEGSKDPGGMGEPVYPSAAPAVANAIFAATGKRVRKFPAKIEELVTV